MVDGPSLGADDGKNDGDVEWCRECSKLGLAVQALPGLNYSVVRFQ